MGRVRREKLLYEQEEDMRRKGKGKKGKKPVSSEEDEYDVGDLDIFEIDGFLVDLEDDVQERANPKQAKKKKKKRKTSKNFVLDHEDLELIRENSSFNQETLRDGNLKRLRKAGAYSEMMTCSSEDEGSLYEDDGDDGSNDDEYDDMAGFIVDEEFGKGDSVRQKKSKGIKHSSSLSKEVKDSFGTEGGLENHTRKVQIQATMSDGPSTYKSCFPTYLHVAEDNCVNDLDIPERMQKIQDIVGSPIDRMSIEEESSWILCQLASNVNPLVSAAKSCRLLNTAKREDIISFLELYHTRKYDIPFIAMYRKEHCLSLLGEPKPDESEVERKPMLKWHQMLWIVQELDKKWLLLQKRKNTLLEYYTKHFEEECKMFFLVEESSFHKEIFYSITNMLMKAETESEVDDIDRKFNLHFPPSEDFSDTGFKRPLTKSYYSNCNKAGLLSLASKFGDPKKFCSLVTFEKLVTNNKEDPQESPEEIASMYKSETFQTSEAVLKGARHMAVMLLNNEIPFRKYVRTIFMDKALVSSSPTLEGNITIDSFHEFSGVKWLQNKPLSKFEDSQWLIIQKAEEEKLLEVKLKLPDHAINELTMTCNDAYLNHSEGISTRLWNEQRKLILQDAISNFLLPSMEKEARGFLIAKSKSWVLMKYAMQLWDRVSVAPYLNNESGTAQQKGVMACCWGNEKPGTTFVMLDSGGELVDVMHARSLTLRSQNIVIQQSKKHDQQCVLRFLTTYQPHVIVLGADNASCLRLREEINQIISMMSELSQNFSQGMKQLPEVVLGDEGLPRLYEDSEISANQLPRQDGIVKRAVALGRYLLNPLAMVATLCGEKNEIASWKLNHRLEKFLTSDDKLEIVEGIMTDVTNQVGIDINLAIRHEWLLSPLQFISGLGPKKAGILRRELLAGDGVTNRRDFVKFGLNTEKVFWNAIGFLRVSCEDENFVDSDSYILDRTRIHPQSYSLSEELAIAVYRKHFPESSQASITGLNALECIQNDPKLLENFDLNEYADRLEIEKGEYKRVTLFDIKMELLNGFKDPRTPYAQPTQEEEFYMITGETGDALVEGKRVQATVRNVLSQQAFCVLESGMTGVLSKDDFLDETENISLTDKLHEGSVLTCKIKLIDKNRCCVNLTCKVSEFNNKDGQCSRDMDPYYRQGNIISVSQLERTGSMDVGIKHVTPRIISHPNFLNITVDQAKQFLADQEIGKYIFHPSSRGFCYLTLSLKICNGVYVHKDILEGGKFQNMKNLLELGDSLKVGEETFQDINQVIELYINPSVVNLKAMINFGKFKNGTKAEVDELLKLEKDEYPNRIPYAFGFSYEHPGNFILSYIRSTNPRHEFVAIHPKGFKFRKQIFESMEQLVAYFQNHINDTVAPAKPQQTEPKAYNEFGNSSDAGRGQGRGGRDSGGGGRGRGRDSGGRGRGFGPMAGPRNNFTEDDKNGGSWGFGDSFAAGNSWEVRDFGEGNGGRQGWGRGRGSRGSQGDDGQGRGSWGGNNDSGRGGRGRGRGRRSYGDDGQGRGSWGGNNDSGRGGRGRGSYGDAGQGGGSWGGNNDSGWRQGQDQGRGRGRGRGRRGGQGDDQGNVSWGGNSHESGMLGGGYTGGDLGQDGGRGRRGNGQGRGRWGENNHEGSYGSAAYRDNGWGGGQVQGRGRARGRRGSPGTSQGDGRWGGNNSNEERDEDSRGRGSWGFGNAHENNATSSSGGWGGTGGRSW